MTPGLIQWVDTFKQPSIQDGVYFGLACKRHLHKSVPLPETLPHELHWVARSPKDTYVISRELMNTHWICQMGLFIWLATLNKSLRALWTQRPVFLITVIIEPGREPGIVGDKQYFPKADSRTDPEQPVKDGKCSKNHVMSRTTKWPNWTYQDSIPVPGTKYLLNKYLLTKE